MKLIERIVLIAIVIAGVAVIGTPLFAALPSLVQDFLVGLATALGWLALSMACLIGSFMGWCMILNH